ncbi:transposase [Thalassotalea piscium]|uniref:REP element-mobilizing transposase RayT n=1 Tax=Thalassotalea piscium TaxID=1230533 RepID=A0A7X0NJE2_9GAMM|nr:transposase [Thalassotalea piscium]MBB6544510.1 REP element-mobilizing transposase RayT [Thalassotalea piscium]
MARPLRLEFSGALYHITSRGNERKPIYIEKSDFESFLNLLGKVCERYNWAVHSFCLMTNHYHLLLETPDANLSKGMRQLNGVYTQCFNRKHRRVGHLFQGRYKAILVDKDAYLLELNRYIVLNPIRAKMVNNLSEWQWSSWHYVMGEVPTPKWLAIDKVLLHFSKYKTTARHKFAKFVEQGKAVNLRGNIINQVFLGNSDFVDEHLALLKDQKDNLSEIPHKQMRKQALSLEEYAKSLSNRDEAINAAYLSGAYTLKEVGDFFKLHYSRVSKIVAKSKT